MIESSIDKEKHEINFGNANSKVAQIMNFSPVGKFDASKRYFQAFTLEGDNVFISDVFIEAPLFEHQESGSTGKMFDHPFYKGIEVDDPDVTNFLQMINKPGSIRKQTYYKATKFV